MTLEPDRVLQQRVLLAGTVALACGGVIILHLSLAPGLRALLLCGWLSLQGHELYRFAIASAYWNRFRFGGDNGISGRTRRGDWTDMSLCPGTFVTPRFAWLRLAAAGGERCQVLVLATRCRPATWRRLQVILRFRV